MELLVNFQIKSVSLCLAAKLNNLSEVNVRTSILPMEDLKNICAPKRAHMPVRVLGACLHAGRYVVRTDEEREKVEKKEERRKKTHPIFAQGEFNSWSKMKRKKKISFKQGKKSRNTGIYLRVYATSHF